MRKRVIGCAIREGSGMEPGWIDLESLAQVEISSEEPERPIEAALVPSTGSGWRAAEPGEQIIRLLFDEPLRIKRVHLVFYEGDVTRTQEFVLRWSADRGKSYQEIRRQQYTFSPPDTACEVEAYDVDLEGVTALELKIVPNISGGSDKASLAQLRVA